MKSPGVTAGACPGSYALSCAGTSCSCSKDNVVLASVPGPATCDGDASAVFTAWQACGFPGLYVSDASSVGAGTDGGLAKSNDMGAVPDDLSATSCMPTLMAMGAGCGAMAMCAGHFYNITCTGTTCQCSLDAVPGTSFAQGMTCSTALMSAWTSTCGFPWN